MFKTVELQTEASENIVDITESINVLVQSSGIVEGACIVYVPHTTAAISVNSAMDVNTPKDILAELNRLIPTRIDFHHQFDTPKDAAGHIKSVLVGNSLSIIIHDGALMLGHSQSILFCEFDGPRKRVVWLNLLSNEV